MNWSKIGLVGMALVVCFVLVFMPAENCTAGLYEWIDDDGVIHLTEDPAEIPEEYRSKVKDYDVSISDPPYYSGIDDYWGPSEELYPDVPEGFWDDDMVEATAPSLSGKDVSVEQELFAQDLVSSVPGIEGAWWSQRISLWVKIDMGVFGSNPKVYAQEIADEVSRAASVKFGWTCARVYHGKQRVLARACGK